METRLTSNNHTFAVVNTTEALVPKFRVAAQMMVTLSTAATAVSLMAHWGMSSGATSS
jgi:hypothetical protein